MSINKKPDCPLIGQNGNIYNLVGIASNTLKEHGMKSEASEMTSRVFASKSYDEALGVIAEYVNVTSVYDEDEYGDDEYYEDEYEKGIEDDDN